VSVPTTPEEQPKSRKWLIVIVAVVVFCCLCALCAAVWASYTYGDIWFGANPWG
jgi:flagellar basal body-associated protein FliL